MPGKNLPPTIQWGNGERKYPIYDEAHIKFMERDDFIKSVCGIVSPTAKPLEEAVLSIWEKQREGGAVKFKVDRATVRMARDYIHYRKRDARLPKFSKWATGMFRDDATLAADLATAGKWEEKSSDIVISCSMADINRNAATPHFSSCLTPGGYYGEVTQQILENCPGIGIAYVKDDKDYMRGRCWIHHAQRVDDGVDCIVVCTKWGGTLTAEQVVEVLRAKGIPAYVGGSYGNQRAGGIPVNFIGCFDRDIHHDMYTWVKGFKVAP